MKIIKAKRPIHNWLMEAVCSQCETKLQIEQSDLFYKPVKSIDGLCGYLHPAFVCCSCGETNTISTGDIPVNVIKTLNERVRT